MVDDAVTLASVLDGGPLCGRPVYVIELPRSVERVLSVPVRPSALLDEWSAARALVPTTGRWPVASISWSGMKVPPTLETFWLDPRGEKAPPPALREAAAQLDGVQAVEEIRTGTRRWGLDQDALRWHLETTRKRCGTAPDQEVVLKSLGELTDSALRWVQPAGPGQLTDQALEPWLLHWEEQHTPTEGPELIDHDDWFVPGEDEAHILFLPTPYGWESLAYLQFYGEDSSVRTNARLVATLRSWHERFGAELVAHWGTMLQFVVRRPPETLADAWEIASEIDLIAPCTNALPGQTVRDSARWLWWRPTWFLHERP